MMKKIKNVLAACVVCLSTVTFAEFNPTDFKDRPVMMQPNDVKYQIRHDLNKCVLADGLIQNYVVYEYNTFSWTLITRIDIVNNSELLPNGKFIETYTAESDSYNHFFSNLKDCNTFRVNYNKALN